MWYFICFLIYFIAWTQISTSSQKPPSVASVPPYSHPPSQSINPVMSPHLVKKKIPAAPPPVTSDMNRQQAVPSSYYNQHYHPPPPVSNNYTSVQKITVGGGYHPTKPPPLQQPSPPAPPQRGPINGTGPTSHHPHHHHHNHNPTQHHPSSYMTTQLQQSVVSSNAMGNPAATHGDQQGMCYCTECSSPHHPQQHHHQGRHKVEDEIMIQKRELDSCWQENEEDFPMVSNLNLFILLLFININLFNVDYGKGFELIKIVGKFNRYIFITATIIVESFV